MSAGGASPAQPLQALRDAPAGEAVLETQDRALALVQFDSRRQLVTRQLALEAWLQEWQTAEASNA
jgi:hypothetical protein